MFGSQELSAASRSCLNEMLNQHLGPGQERYPEEPMSPENLNNLHVYLNLFIPPGEGRFPEAPLSLESAARLRDFVDMVAASTPSELELLVGRLIDAGIDLSFWGIEKAKSVSDLLTEIEAGETVLMTEKGQLLRVTSVAAIEVRYTDPSGKEYRLVEAEQVWHDGSGRRRIRQLPQSLSEKMTGPEKNHPLATIIRGIGEELKVIISEENVGPITVAAPIKPTDTYPGLLCQYQVYSCTVRIPATSFNPDGYTEDDGVKTSTFKWVEVNEGTIQ